MIHAHVPLANISWWADKFVTSELLFDYIVTLAKMVDHLSEIPRSGTLILMMDF